VNDLKPDTARGLEAVAIEF